MFKKKPGWLVVVTCGAVLLTASLAMAKPRPEKDIVDTAVAAGSLKTWRLPCRPRGLWIR